MLTDNDLAIMRDAIEDLLPSHCHILSATLASDGQGGQIETWGTATANAKCRLDWKNGDERVFGSSLQPYVGWVLSLPYDATVTTTNRVKVNETVYNVAMVDNNKSWNAVIRCALKEVQ